MQKLSKIKLNGPKADGGREGNIHVFNKYAFRMEQAYYTKRGPELI